MNELDEAWSEMLARAAAEARHSGSGDVDDYLALKAANDTIRETSINWLLDCVLELASQADSLNAPFSIERNDKHTFSQGSANLVGTVLRVRQGVRCISIEAGWTRSPGDGFMRGGALAIARITHFGLAKSNAELMLMRLGDAPAWFEVLSERERGEFGARHLVEHFRIFLGR